MVFDTVLNRFWRDTVCTCKSKGGYVCSLSGTYMFSEHVSTLFLEGFLSNDTCLFYVTQPIKLWLLRNANAKSNELLNYN